MLKSLGARHVTQGSFFLDKKLERDGEGLRIEAQAAERFEPIYREFVASVRSVARDRATASAT